MANLTSIEFRDMKQCHVEIQIFVASVNLRQRRGTDKSFFPQNWQLMCRAWNVKNAMLLPHFWLFWHFLTICLKLVLQCIGITKRVLGWKKLRIQQAFVVEHHKNFVHCLRQHNHDFNWIFIKHSRRFRIVLLKIALSTYVLLTK